MTKFLKSLFLKADFTFKSQFLNEYDHVQVPPIKLVARDSGVQSIGFVSKEKLDKGFEQKKCDAF